MKNASVKLIQNFLYEKDQELHQPHQIYKKELSYI